MANIAGIYNYCFRWCERCPFTGQCTSYEMLKSAEEIGGQFVGTTNRILPGLPTNFEAVIAELKRHCQAVSYDWETIDCELEELHPTISALRLEEIREFSLRYTVRLSRLLKGLSPEKIPLSWVIPIQVLRWYGGILGPKVARASGALLEENNKDVNSIAALQSDGNLTAKLAVLSIVRSLAALTILLRDPQTLEEELFTVVFDLLKLQQSLRFYYPHMADGERPGFDEEEYDELIMNFYKGHLPIDPFRDGPWITTGGPASDQ